MEWGIRFSKEKPKSYGYPRLPGENSQETRQHNQTGDSIALPLIMKQAVAFSRSLGQGHEIHVFISEPDINRNIVLI